ncbi:MAG: FixH family protein [Prevotella sp.]|nr:FixH family protein [Prevotella sp.]MBR4899130.1 FixH family protein [Prevotella sp.]
MRIIKNYIWVLAVLFGTVFTSCNSNDDFGSQVIEIPGITIDGDIDCCSAEEALQVYKFLQTVKIIPELSTTIDGKYDVFAYSRNGSFHTGYNEIFFVATKKKNGNYIKNFDVTSLTPLMLMVKMNMKHSTPVGGSAESFNDNYLAVKRTWVSFVMNTSEAGSWTLGYNVSVLGSNGGIEAADIVVDALPEGQQWLKSFKVGDNTYYLSLVNPTDWQTGKNSIKAYVSKKNTPATTPYGLAQEQFTIEIDPRMPDMGNHTSPDNVALTKQANGSYQGTVNLTMTGRWRIHLAVKDEKGNVVAGGDDLSDGFSSLFWEVTI